MRLLLVFMLLFSIPAFAQTDDQISQSIRIGDTKSLCAFLADDVSMKIIDKEDIYSRVQAEMIIKDFFSKNTPKTYTPKHNGTSRSGAQYTIGRLETSNGAYRTSYFTKKIGTSLIIQEFRIEKE